MTLRAVLFLDVDGTLLPFTDRPGTPPAPAARDNPLLHRLDPADGPRLAALRCDLVWATTWMAEANDVIAPRLGLPPLPVVDWSDADPPPGGVHWKTPDLVAWAGARPFAWLDDEITDADREWVGGHHPGPALLHRVDPRTGLTSADLTTVERWLGGPAGPYARSPSISPDLATSTGGPHDDP